MQIVKVIGTGKQYQYKWPDGSKEKYAYWIDYDAKSEDGDHHVRVGFGERWAFGKERLRVVVWIDGYPHAEFFNADDFEFSGDLISQIREAGSMCRYPEDPVPEQYSIFHLVGLPTKINAKGVHNAWAVIANLSDHKTMIAFAALKRLERK